MPVEHPVYPVNLVLDQLPCLVVGAGPVAARKAQALVQAGAAVTMVAPRVSPESEALGVAIERRAYRQGEAGHFHLVVTATDDPAVNSQVAADARAGGTFVNSADDPANCTFTLPARLDRGDLSVAVSTAGHSPAVAVWVRDQIGNMIDDVYVELVAVAGQVRTELRDSGHPTEGLPWQEGLSSGILELIRSGRREQAVRQLRAAVTGGTESGQVTAPTDTASSKEHRPA